MSKAAFSRLQLAAALIGVYHALSLTLNGPVGLISTQNMTTTPQTPVLPFALLMTVLYSRICAGYRVPLPLLERAPTISG